MLGKIKNFLKKKPKTQDLEAIEMRNKHLKHLDEVTKQVDQHYSKLDALDKLIIIWLEDETDVCAQDYDFLLKNKMTRHYFGKYTKKQFTQSIAKLVEVGLIKKTDMSGGGYSVTDSDLSFTYYRRAQSEQTCILCKNIAKHQVFVIQDHWSVPFCTIHYALMQSDAKKTYAKIDKSLE